MNWPSRMPRLRFHQGQLGAVLHFKSTVMDSRLECDFVDLKGSSMRLLIADGDRAFLEILRRHLRDRGHEVEIAIDGFDCITILRDFLPEIVILEHKLLWGGGDGVIALMRDDPTLSEIPIILTGEESRSEQFDVLVSPPHIDWLQKPFRLNDLLRHIQLVESGQRILEHP